jgi:hypothetical protein
MASIEPAVRAGLIILRAVLICSYLSRITSFAVDLVQRDASILFNSLISANNLAGRHPRKPILENLRRTAGRKERSEFARGEEIQVLSLGTEVQIWTQRAGLHCGNQREYIPIRCNNRFRGG